MILDQINKDLLLLAQQADNQLADIFAEIDKVCLYKSKRKKT